MPEKLKCETRGRPYLCGVDCNRHEAIVFQPRCGLWSCPACAETNAELWALRTLNGIKELKSAGHEIYFTTITTHEDLSPEIALKIWPKQWGKLRQRASRAALVFEYLLVPEQHKTKKIHVHLLDTGALPERWWKDNARQCGMGFMATSEQLRNPAQGAKYVTKYLAKQLKDNVWPRGFRRVRTSQHWPKLPTMPDSNFDFMPVPPDMALNDFVLQLTFAGFDVHLSPDGETAWDFVRSIDKGGNIE